MFDNLRIKQCIDQYTHIYYICAGIRHSARLANNFSISNLSKLFNDVCSFRINQVEMRRSLPASCTNIVDNIAADDGDDGAALTGTMTITTFEILISNP